MTQRPGSARLAFIAAVLVALLPIAAYAQVYVYPRRPNKSQVRYYDFDWRHVDILVGPEADTSRADELNRRPVDPPPRPPDQAGPQEVPHVPPPTELPGDAPAPAPQNPPLPEAPAPPPADDAPFTERSLPPGKSPRQLLTERTGGVRLYFYEREREVAERAAALIVESYLYLVSQFGYVPTETFPYILYSSYQEFLQTNLFPLQEGTLGVTSPVDLKLTLPYFGDHKLFAEVSAHEMAHQFTIQKVRAASRKAQVWGEPLGAIPLWFIEGLAEYYAKRGIDPEADMLVRDIVINPDFEMGYTLLEFFEDRPYSVLWTYKMGQVRCAFLEETYGNGTIQKVLDESPRLMGEVRGVAAVDRFELLLQRLTGDDPVRLAAKFEAWLKRRAFRSYLAAEQAEPAVQPLEDFGEQYVDALQASPSGDLIALRSMDPETARSRLTLLDRRAARRGVRVAVDGVPGSESLHPVWGRNFALADDQIAWVAESGGNDVLYLQAIEHRAEPRAVSVVKQDLPPPPPPRPPGFPPAPGLRPEEPRQEVATQEDAWSIRLRLGHKRTFNLGAKGLIAAYSPAFSPDGKRIAFIGFDLRGNRDVYVIEPGTGNDFGLIRLTEDVYAERQLSWAKDGIVFNSDATSHGHYNLFRVRPEAPKQVERLTTEPRDHLDPQALPDGRIIFTAFDRGRADVHEVTNGSIVRRTDITTGLFDLAPGPEGGVWALFHESGRRKPVLVTRERLGQMESLPQPEASPPREIQSRPLADAVPYEPLRPGNWELGPPFAFIGAGGGSIYGQVAASAADKLRNHGLFLNVAVLGSFKLTDGYLVYLNQERRLTWGTGLFQSLIYRRDRSVDTDILALGVDRLGNIVETPYTLVSIERFSGALGSARYPFNRFVHVQADLSVGAVGYFLLDDDEKLLSSCEERPDRSFLCPDLRPVDARDPPSINVSEIWREKNPSPRLQTEVTLRLGFDTIRYSARGPIAGSSFLVEGSTAVQPFDDELFGTLRVDGERYFPLFGGLNFMLRGGAGVTLGSRLARQFYLSSFDTLRGVNFADSRFLLGRHFFFSTAELRVPLNAIIRVVILNNIEAIAGVDFGGMGRAETIDFKDLVERRVLAPVLGVNFGLGPLVLRLHFARPINIGAPLPVDREGEWVTNFSIRILGFEGFFDRSSAAVGLRRPAL